MYKFDQLLQIVETEISHLNIPQSPQMLYTPIRYAMEKGGKRIRPVSLLMSCNIFSNDIAQALPASMAIEVFHNFTLLHDDIMDNAPTRRGRPTVYKKWNNNIAILSGDAMMIYAYNLLAHSPSSELKHVLDTFNNISIGVCEGQSLDMEFESRERVTVDEYMHMVELKTAVLLAGAFKIGALLGGASEKEADLMYDYGINIGLAFQIQDDILDTYSDETTFGKTIGGDILENKKTFLLTNAYALADINTQKDLNQLLTNTNIAPQDKILGVKNIYDKLAVKSIAEKAVDEYFTKADKLLSDLNIPEERLEFMRELANIVMKRRK